MTNYPDIAGRRLLVVGAGQLRDRAFCVWHRMGLEIVLADGFTGSRYAHLADEFAALDPRDRSAEIAGLRELAQDCHGVVTLADNSQVTAAVIAEDLGLPGPGKAVAEVARSKLRQRVLCERAGFTVPRWREVRSAADLEDFFTGQDGPAVLKPVDAAGGAGVLLVQDAAAAARELPVSRALSPGRTVIIEDYLDGREVCVDAAVYEGAVVFLSVCLTGLSAATGFMAVSATYAADQPDHPAAVTEVSRLVTALGLVSGLVHAEFRISGGRWTVIETAFRPGGMLVPDLTERVTGVNLYAAQACLALGQHPLAAQPPPVARQEYAIVRFLLAQGEVRRTVPAAQVLAGLPDVRIVEQSAGPGQQVRLPLSDEGRAGYAVGWGPDRERLDAQLRQALDRLAAGIGVLPVGSRPAASAA